MQAWPWGADATRHARVPRHAATPDAVAWLLASPHLRCCVSLLSNVCMFIFLQALFDLEATNAELKGDLRDL